MLFGVSKNKFDYLLTIAKIAIIVSVGIFLLGFFFPFYEYPNDSKVYGFTAIRISEGKYDYTNEILQETGFWEFVPGALVKTPDNSAIPNILPLFPAIGAFFFKIFGNHGLFYLNPILTIIFLIISERITSKYFNKYVGFFVLIFLATNEMTFWVGRGLLTSMIFSIFFIVGINYLLKFLKTRSYNAVFYSSVFFTLTAFIRPNGVVFVPIEGIVIIGYLIFEQIQNKKNKNFQKRDIKKIIKTAGLIIGPWLVFVIFMVSFNVYYFDDPTTTVYNVPGAPRHYITETNVNAFSINYERVEKYSGHFLPYPLNRVAASLNYGETSASAQFDNAVNSLKQFEIFSHIGLLTFVVIFAALYISWKKKEYRMNCSVYSIFIIGLIIFYSIQLIVVGRQGSPRDMLPVYPLFYSLLGYIIVKILTSSTRKYDIKKKISLRTLKYFTLIILIFFIPTSFVFADYSQIIKNDGFEFKDPISLSKNYNDLDYQIPEGSIVVTFFEYDEVIRTNTIPFTPLGWIPTGFDPQNELYVQMIDKLKSVLQNGERDVFIYKDPHLEHEKRLHIYLSNSENIIFKDFSKEFCKVSLGTNQDSKSDKVCLEHP